MDANIIRYHASEIGKILKEDIWNLVIKGNKSYEEILQMIADSTMEENKI